MNQMNKPISAVMISAMTKAVAGVALALCLVGAPALVTETFASDENAQKDESKKQKNDGAKAAPAKKLSPLAAAAAASRARKTQKAKEKTVFTTEDLKKRFEGTEPQGGVYQRDNGEQAPAATTQQGRLMPNPNGENPAATAAPKFDPQAMLKQRDADQADANRARDAAKAELSQLQARVTALEKRRLALVNPYLARPKAEGTDEQKKAWEAKDNAARVKQTDEELAKARAALADAQKRAGQR